MNTPTMIGWTIRGRVHWQLNLRMVTYPSNIAILCNLTSKVPWDPSEGQPLRTPTTGRANTQFLLMKTLHNSTCFFFKHNWPLHLGKRSPINLLGSNWNELTWNMQKNWEGKISTTLYDRCHELKFLFYHKWQTYQYYHAMWFFYGCGITASIFYWTRDP